MALSKKGKKLAKHPISRALREMSKRGEQDIKYKKTWAVYVEKVGSGMFHVHKPLFRSGHQYFNIGYVCTGDEGGKKKADWFVKMFLKALKNMGVDISKRKRR
jgi:hypothetical protein